MSQIDLDDLPPKIANQLASVKPGEELVLVRGGLLIARLTVSDETLLTPPEPLEGLPAEEHVAEVMSQFNAMIHDEF